MSLNLWNIQKEMKLLFLVQQPEGYDSKDFLSAELLLIFDLEPENVAVSTSKANTIESLPASKKSDCVYPLKTISTRLNLLNSAACGQKIMLEILWRELWIISTTAIQPTTVQDQSMSLQLLVCV